jgi:hypothetical protein
MTARTDLLSQMTVGACSPRVPNAVLKDSSLGSLLISSHFKNIFGFVPTRFLLNALSNLKVESFVFSN